MSNAIILSPAQELIYIKDMTDIIDFKSINKEFNNEKFIKNEFNEISLKLDFFDNKKFQNIKKALELECKNYLNDCYDIKDLYDDITITNSWCNITNPKQSHHKHSHPLSVVSGVIFLDNNINNLNLNFNLKNKSSQIPYFLKQDVEADLSLKTILEMSHLDSKNHNNLKNYLILFLSNLPHFVTPTPINAIPRKSISFNTFWKGMVGNKNQALSSLSFDKLTTLSKHNL
jgi:hypothetical protein